jgi:hypothetical protein
MEDPSVVWTTCNMDGQVTTECCGIEADRMRGRDAEVGIVSLSYVLQSKSYGQCACAFSTRYSR